jgi:molybdenum cofactor cytidylyltransferase/nicotine blue oxidoreductase
MTGTEMSIATQPFLAILLAAGEGSRLGRIPKSLLRVDDQTLLERQIFALLNAGAVHIAVVTGHFYSDIEAELQRVLKLVAAPIQIVRNTQPERGQQSSVALGLSALAEHQTEQPVLIALADQPLMQAADYTACMRAFYNRPDKGAIVYPIVGHQRGNPVILSDQIMRNVLASGMSCRDYIHTHPEYVYRFATDCDHFVFDVDAPSDLDRFRQRTGLTMILPKNSNLTRL